ncbi:MAG: M20/M25/M40 family metallo-hydrolase [Deltaproteobacteria bacterium]|nr:M20/M25/M40 family metallo-hydrolase [Deltaproteobacteria bacterium]
MTDLRAVADLTEKLCPAWLERLPRYVAIQGVSMQPEHAADVRRLANLVAADLRDIGVRDVAVRDLPGKPDALPIVTGEIGPDDPKAPTVLVYGHYDTQPSEPSTWKVSHPLEVKEKDGRLYGRGTADDLGGWLSHFAALEAWKKHGGVPVRVKLILEGEEESGSTHLEGYMDAYPDVFTADAMVLTDCENPDVETAGLTVSLRGLVTMDVVARSLTGRVHSGVFGGIVPDPVMALFKAASSLVDERGRIVGLSADVSDAERVSLRKAFDPAELKGHPLLPGVEPLPNDDRPAAELLWRQPSLTIIGADVTPVAQSANAVAPECRVRLSLRVPPGMEPDVVEQHARARLEAMRPFGLALEVSRVGVSAQSWLYEPKGPAFDAFDRACTIGFGKPFRKIGIGGTIPFIALFGRRFAGVPLILNGVMDPLTNAHGPDESLDIALFNKVARTNAVLYGELATVLRAR